MLFPAGCIVDKTLHIPCGEEIKYFLWRLCPHLFYWNHTLRIIGLNFWTRLFLSSFLFSRLLLFLWLLLFFGLLLGWWDLLLTSNLFFRYFGWWYWLCSFSFKLFKGDLIENIIKFGSKSRKILKYKSSIPTIILG